MAEASPVPTTRRLVGTASSTALATDTGVAGMPAAMGFAFWAACCLQDGTSNVVAHKRSIKDCRTGDTQHSHCSKETAKTLLTVTRRPGRLRLIRTRKILQPHVVELEVVPEVTARPFD